MKGAVLKYNVLVRREGKSYVAHVPALGISDFGPTLDRALENLREAMLCHIEGLVRTNSEVPKPDADGVYLTQTEITIPNSLQFAV